jgi:hypothetical protein
MGIFYKTLITAFNTFVEDNSISNAEVLLKQLNKYLTQLEERKAYANEKELEIIGNQAAKYKDVAVCLEQIPYGFETIESRISQFPYPYYNQLNAKDRVSVFPKKDTTHDENLQIIDTTSSRFLKKVEFLLTDEAKFIKKAYFASPEGKLEEAKIQEEGKRQEEARRQAEIKRKEEEAKIQAEAKRQKFLAMTP